jgi:L-asparaginase II
LNAPLSVFVTRGPLNESEHLVDAVIMNADKKILESYGDITSPVYPRSAIKMLQAMLVIESGAYESQKLDARHLALASSSHYADPVHTELVHEWLAKYNLTEDNLRCGVQSPTRDTVRDALLLAHLKPNRGHNNCSGKHSGLLSVCVQKNYETKNYDDYNHPVQKDLIHLLSTVYEHDIAKAPYGVDGCGIPTIAVPLFNLAVGHVNLFKRTSGKLILDAVSKYPDLISGQNNFPTEITRATNGRVFAKVGAEGVYCALSPQDNIYIALKVRDGGSRASQLATAALLKKFGCIHNETEEKLLEKFLNPKIKNWEGLVVGEIKV